jgi:hypothetical protein
MRFERLQQRAGQVAQRAVDRARVRIVERLSGEGLRAEVSERGVTIRGRNLLRRLVMDERLRWIGRLFR